MVVSIKCIIALIGLVIQTLVSLQGLAVIVSTSSHTHTTHCACVCMHKNTHAYTYTHTMHTYTDIHTCACMCIHTHARTHACTHTSMHAHNTHMYVCVCMCTCMLVSSKLLHIVADRYVSVFMCSNITVKYSIKAISWLRLPSANLYRVLLPSIV